ncbi:hypothetical protein DCBHLPFO_00787 [Mycoplasmopsis arginini]|uniref:Uncharacterized protein n=1 Tax=Mycoplasmopsis arginini TaxID=2094 RepID=A0AA43QYS9_MYCAR|nr:hypothetical protein [Mycoplasmopsis arginini]
MSSVAASWITSITSSLVIIPISLSSWFVTGKTDISYSLKIFAALSCLSFALRDFTGEYISSILAFGFAKTISSSVKTPSNFWVGLTT